MDEDRVIAVSPRHSVRLAREYVVLVDHAPMQDYVVRTITRREANGMPLMTAEIVIAGREARERFPLAARYPLHFRKSYTSARLHGDATVELEAQRAAEKLVHVPPAIGATESTYRSCLVPGNPYPRVSPFGAEPDEANLRLAKEVSLAEAAGLWHLLEQAFSTLATLHDGGLAHGDAELHNFIVSPSPLEMVLIDYESVVRKSAVDDATWKARILADFAPLLKESIYVEVALGRQEGPLANAAHAAMSTLFKDPGRFERAIDDHDGF
ncbi:MAG TPA: hypothetical protein VHE30_24820 [Polyangiaceae bacterium]|nr:hypothetical protein [Polyangiaceae bacterium]